MRITNELYMNCPKCGAEASGLENIQKVFGYKIVNDDIMPYHDCRKCRSKEAEEEHTFNNRKRDKRWASAANWGRDIHISRRKFESYLIELGYLENGSEKKRRDNNLKVTEKGKLHSAVTNSPFSKIVLWDFETFTNVVMMRAKQAIVHECCPKCNAYLDTMPGYNYLDYEHECKRCGRVCDSWKVSAIYDR